MANRIGPMDQSFIGKIGNKVDDTGVTRKLSGDTDTAGGVAAGSVSKGDTVELTSSAKLLERLEKTLASLPDINSSRVAEVKAAIENGEYSIDADAIADAMIRFEQSLGD